MKPFFAALALLALPLLVGCGAAVYRPPGSATLDLHPEAEINDEDVKKAFEARPQMSTTLRVAYFSLDASKADDVEKMIRTVPGVSDTYRIPALLVTGERRYADAGQHGYMQPGPQPISLKKLRLIAAKAQADVLLLFDYGNKVEDSPNAWVATGVLLLPLLFTPFLDTETESYLDSYLVDTRNGYLYAQVSSQEKERSGRHTIYSRPESKALPKQWSQLLDDTRKKLIEVADSERAKKNPAPK